MDNTFNKELWEQRWTDLLAQFKELEDSYHEIRTALFGNGKKTHSIQADVIANTKHRKEWEDIMHDLQKTLLRRMFLAMLAVTVILMGGLGGIGLLLANTIKAVLAN